ncbi:ankyrin repeat-containing domain protein [Xylaria sp. FL0043]|nr:ankyrin repeat-containing domain protein [Xylaria sp. FL0043]
MGKLSNGVIEPHICAMPDEILLEIARWLTEEQDVLNWTKSSKRIFGVGNERLIRLSAAGSGSGLRWAIVNDDLPLFEVMLKNGPPNLPNRIFDYKTRLKTTRKDDDKINITAANPLNTAVAYGRTQFVRRLLQAGADKESAPISENPGLTRIPTWLAFRDARAIAWALAPGKQRPCSDIIEVLLDHDVNIDVHAPSLEHFVHLREWASNLAPADNDHVLGALVRRRLGFRSPLERALCSNHVSEQLLHRLLQAHRPGPRALDSESEEDYKESLKSFFRDNACPGGGRRLKIRSKRGLEKLQVLLAFGAEHQDASSTVESLKYILGRFVPGTHLLSCVRLYLQYIRQRDPTGGLLNQRGVEGPNAFASALFCLISCIIDRDDESWCAWNPKEGYEELFTMLLAAGACPNGGAAQGRHTPLGIICGERRLWVGSDLGAHFTRFFLDHNARVDCGDCYGWIPLEWAASMLVADAVSLLLLRGGSHHVNFRSPSAGRTPLMHACTIIDHGNKPGDYPSRIEVIQLLLRHGANPNLPDNSGRTALHYLCDSSKVHFQPLRSILHLVWNLLLDAGADGLHRDNIGRSPLDVCQHQGILLPDKLLDKIFKNKSAIEESKPT